MVRAPTRTMSVNLFGLMLPMLEITSCRVVERYTTHISLKKHLTSYQKRFLVRELVESYIYGLEHYVHV